MRYNFVPAFRKLSKGGTEIVHTCVSCRIPGFCTSIVFAFISGVELFDYVVDEEGGIRESLPREESHMRDMGSRLGRIKP